MPTPQDILDYWFGAIDPKTGMPTKPKYDLWFGKSKKTDDFLRKNYTKLLEEAKNNELDHWTQQTNSYIVLIVLLDQFSRNIYRDDPRMFEADPKALQLTKNKLNIKLPTIQKVFQYMPFMHSENLTDQEKCVQLFKELHQKAHPEVKESIANNLDYAIAHRDIIKKYGRFPHRNKILNRESTPEEKEYLSQPGAGF